MDDELNDFVLGNKARKQLLEKKHMSVLRFFLVK